MAFSTFDIADTEMESTMGRILAAARVHHSFDCTDD
jgi:hypothetical protein